jgi:cobalt-zinc-cadmium efflux system outer membrane protein
MCFQHPISILVSVALLLGYAATHAETPDSKPRPVERRVASAATVTAEGLVAEALAKNPELNYYRAEIKAARGERRTAGEWANPEATSDVGAKIVNDSNGNSLGQGATWSISAAQTFEYPGRVSLRKAIANRQIALAETGLEGFKVALAARVRSLALRVIVNEERVAAVRKVSERFEELISVLSQRPTAGVAPLLDTRLIEANAIALNRRKAETARDLQSAMYEINQLRGSPIEAGLNLGKSDLTFSPLPALEELLNAARSDSYEVRTRLVELEQRGLKVKLARNERWPAIKIGPLVSNERADTSEYRVGIGFNLALPIWNQNAGNIETANAKAIQAEASLSATIRAVERKVADAAFAYETQRDELMKLQPVTLDQLREAAELADRNYRSGAVPVVTYTEVQKQYLDAIDALAAAQIGALENRQQIEQETGLHLDGRASLKRKTNK